MNTFALVFLCVFAVLSFILPRSLALLPLICVAAYMTQGQDVQIAGMHFTVLRLLMMAIAVRCILRREGLSGGLYGLDKRMLFFSVVAVASGLFREDVVPALVSRLGLVYDLAGSYFLFRVFIVDSDSIFRLSKIVVMALLPIAAEMVYESVTGFNNFAFLGGVDLHCELRSGSYRAQGPFSHSILAGTVGAACFPLMLPYFKKHLCWTVTGLIVCSVIVFTSRSSGPIMTVFAGLVALGAWHIRKHMKPFRRFATVGVFALHLVMNAPVYYLLARIDLTGNSTGHHRSELINAAILHFDEWWLFGTDYTRHWMATGVDWSNDHADITNHYIKMGVIGGVPLVLAFIEVLKETFKLVGRTMVAAQYGSDAETFRAWAWGAILFAHVTALVSVSYYDQSIVFFSMILGGVVCAHTVARNFYGVVANRDC